MRQISENILVQDTIIKNWKVYLQEYTEDIIDGLVLAISSVLKKDKWEELGISDEDIDFHQKDIRSRVEQLLRHKNDQDPKTVLGIKLTIEEKEDLAFEVLWETQKFIWRKLLFEHYIDEEFPAYKSFDFLNYSTSIDYILRRTHNCDSLRIQDLLKIVDKRTKNENEIKLVFKLLYRQLQWDKQANIEEILENSFDIIKRFEWWRVSLNRATAKKIERSAIMSSLLDEEIHSGNIEKNKDIYTYIPNSSGGKYWEKNDLMKTANGLLKKIHPVIDDVDDLMEKASMLYKDGKKVKKIKKNLEQIWEALKFISDKTWITKGGQYLKSKMRAYDEFKIKHLVKAKRRRTKSSLWEEEHIEVMKKYLHLKSNMKKIYLSTVSDWKKLQPNSKIELIDHAIKEMKKQPWKSAFAMWWKAIIRIGVKSKASLALIKVLKVRLFAGIMFYKWIWFVSKRIKRTDTVKRYKFIRYMRKWYKLESSTKILEFLIRHNWKLSELPKWWDIKKDQIPIGKWPHLQYELARNFIELINESSALLNKSFNETKTTSSFS